MTCRQHNLHIETAAHNDGKRQIRSRNTPEYRLALVRTILRQQSIHQLNGEKTMTRSTSLPSDDDIRRLINEAIRSPDPRSLPAVGLLISQGLSIRRLDRLRWANWDRIGRTIIIARGASPEKTICLTNLLQLRLAAIPRKNSPFIFAPLDLYSPSLAVLFVQLCNRIRLGKYIVADFLAWSEAQTPAVRISTVTT
jgi:hypothetical protein